MAHANEKEAGQSAVKIQDRRRFDMDGNERDRAEAEQLSQAAAGDQNAGSGRIAGAQQSGSQAQAMPELNFSSFVISLATQALMQLGQIKPPEGIQISVDRIAAKQTIDILNMLEGKTKGNLDKEEEQLLEEVLHNLRLSFVKAV